MTDSGSGFGSSPRIRRSRASYREVLRPQPALPEAPGLEEKPGAYRSRVMELLAGLTRRPFDDHRDDCHERIHPGLRNLNTNWSVRPRTDGENTGWS